MHSYPLIIATVPTRADSILHGGFTRPEDARGEYILPGLCLIGRLRMQGVSTLPSGRFVLGRTALAR